MPSILIEYQHEVKTVSKQCQNSEFLITEYRPLQLHVELHQKDLRINLYLVHILGMVLRHVSGGGHLSGLKSNRPLFEVQTVTLAPTCR